MFVNDLVKLLIVGRASRKFTQVIAVKPLNNITQVKEWVSETTGQSIFSPKKSNSSECNWVNVTSYAIV